MTYSDNGQRDTLQYRLSSQTSEDPGLWGHEYVRHLAAELGQEYSERIVAVRDFDAEPADDADEEEETAMSVFATGEAMVDLAMELIQFFLKHNGEADAVDLALEVEQSSRLVDLVDEKTFPRVCQYMIR
jgi:26S proteasome regulatory subunit N1